MKVLPIQRLMSNRFILPLVALPLLLAQIVVAEDGPRAFVPARAQGNEN